MSDSAKIKLLAGSTLLLILLNVVIVAMVWFHPHPPQRDREGGGPSAAIIHELNFEGEQLTQFEELRDEHHHAMVMLNEKNRHLHDALFDLVKSGQDSTATSDSLINEIADIKKQTESVTYHHVTQVRQMCTPEQKKKFDQIIINLMAHMNEPPPQRRDR